MKDLHRRQLVIVSDEAIRHSRVFSGAINQLVRALEKRQIHAETLASYAEAVPVLGNNMALDAVLIAVDPDGDLPTAEQADALLKLLKQRQDATPVFLLADRSGGAGKIDLALMEKADEYLWILEDSSDFAAGRIESAISRYRRGLLPPLMQAIWDYNENFHEYSWAAPGHQGGRGFTKSPSGRKFYDFYDENLFRTDTGIERSSIGSLLDHTGAFASSEKFAARTFGADFSFSGVVGSSGSNRTIMQALLTPGDLAYCDRNCHKSIEQGLILTGAVPVYLPVSRNAYGIIGPIPSSELTAASLRRKVGQLPFPISERNRNYAVITNCTYDGLCYRADRVEKLLADSVDCIHFDEAWYAYARFNPMYRNASAMRGEPRDAPKDHPTVLATHSTHKLLAALSQASYIHVRNGRKPLDPDRFNQAYMMHTTTSPLYAICASNDIAGKMMAEAGPALTQEVIDEAVDFRQNLDRITREFSAQSEWFFRPWQPPKVADAGTRDFRDFADAPHDCLARKQECWMLHPGEEWHGFAGLDEDWAMLDPIKVSILTPGIDSNGRYADTGVPAALAAKFLYREGIVPTRATDFQLMFLFSIGITRGKWMTLLNLLLEFKRNYDRNVPLKEILPDLCANCRGRYDRMGLRDLGEKMFSYLKEHRPTALLAAAFDRLPEPKTTPRDAYMHLVRGEVELIPVDRLAGQVAATAVIPYPPGIPMLMSGECFGDADSPQLAYLKQLSDWDRTFPGFEHDTEGSQVIDRVYHFWCVKA